MLKEGERKGERELTKEQEIGKPRERRMGKMVEIDRHGMA